MPGTKYRNGVSSGKTGPNDGVGTGGRISLTINQEGLRPFSEEVCSQKRNSKLGSAWEGWTRNKKKMPSCNPAAWKKGGAGSSGKAYGGVGRCGVRYGN